MARATCPHCQEPMKVRDADLGKAVRCPLCSKTLTLPHPDDDDIEDSPPPRKRSSRSRSSSEASASSNVTVNVRGNRRSFCPYCDSDYPPSNKKKLSTVGILILLAICIFPFNFLGLLMQEEYRVCGDCGKIL